MGGVVVGVDDSQGARAALVWALRYAQREQVPLTVVTVVDPLVATALWDDLPPHNVKAQHLDGARHDAERMLTEALNESADTTEVQASVHVTMGHPVKELVEAAKDADLLVVGSRGGGIFSRLMLGSTSSGVVHHATCSVTIVRRTPR